MAGSYRHCERKGKETDDPMKPYEPTGEFDTEGFYDMIENMGDAYEACHEMFYMIQYLARLTMMQPEQAVENAEDDYFKVVRGEKPNPYWRE